MNFSTKDKITYFIIAVILLITEIIIALYAPSSSFIRHSLGDFLVVVLIYFSIKTSFVVDAKILAISTAIFAFFIEALQYFEVLNTLGITNQIIRIILGTSFSYADLVMYFLGSIAAYYLDTKLEGCPRTGVVARES